MKKFDRIGFSSTFNKQLKKAPLKIRIAFKKRVELFLIDPFNSQLKNHKLTGKLKNYTSINITGDWRALYSKNEINKENVVIFEALGTHSQLYK